MRTKPFTFTFKDALRQECIQALCRKFGAPRVFKPQMLSQEELEKLQEFIRRKKELKKMYRGEK